MSEVHQTADRKPRQRRQRLFVIFLFILLILHFVLVYTKPQWLLISEYPSSRSTQFYRRLGGTISGKAPREPRVIETDRRRYLWGGHDESQHFDITDFRLNAKGLHYGLGREHFAALIEPEFVSSDDATAWLPVESLVLAVKIADEVKI